jgi:NAD(P)-dependent dehydrogenase (short-subunit alcohol dehydrogenase family)
MKLLEGKHAIITGAGSSRGLGRAAARLFAEHGATVAMLDLRAAELQEAASELGTRHTGRACDVTSREACQQVVEALIGEWGKVDVLVNNAGITQPLKVMEIGPEQYDAVLDVNLRGTLYMSQAVIPHMKARRSGSIINMSSVSGKRGGGIFGGPHYSAAKAGIMGLSKAMARELAPFNIRSNSICPGFIDTDITAGKMTDEMMQAVLSGIPMNRIGKPQEVAGCCLFLASELSGYVTGSDLDVNGGSLIY